MKTKYIIKVLLLNVDFTKSFCCLSFLIDCFKKLDYILSFGKMSAMMSTENQN